MTYLRLSVTTMFLAGCAGGGAGGGGADAGGNGWVQVTPAPEGTGPMMTISGTVRHLDLEGGVYVIEEAGGTRYNPMNLPEAFREDGKAVEAEARRRDDMMSVGMVGPMIELMRIREREGTAGGTGEGAAPALGGTVWQLEDLGGAGVIDDAQATLEFAEGGSVSGNGSCNRFRGTATVSGSDISFGPLALTRMACPEAIMNQENAFLAALGKASRFEVKDSFLYIHSAGGAAPLRFVRK